jgi:hypothetical protein
MILRGSEPEATVWTRFHPIGDGFLVAEREGIYEVRVAVNAERAVDLFQALLENFPPAVAVRVDDYRSGRHWQGEGIALPDVREVIARLKLPLATYGGVEFTVYSETDQASLTPHLELFLYSRSERWIYLLRGKGLVERRAERGRSWRLRAEDFPPAPDLAQALALATERLSLGTTET